MSHKIFCIHNNFILKLILFLFVTFSSCVSFSAQPNTSLFIWGQWIQVKVNPDAGRGISIKLKKKDKLTIHTQTQVDPEPGKYLAPTPKNTDFRFASLPEMVSGNYTVEGEASAEIPPVLALGYGLLFSKKPQLPGSQEGESDGESRSRFVEKSKLKVEPGTEEVIFTITGTDAVSSSEASPATSQTKIIITVRKSSKREDLVDAVYDLEYHQTGGKLLKAHYTIEGASNPVEAPFLKRALIDKASTFFELSAKG